MKHLILAAAATAIMLAGAAPALASDEDDVVAVVKAFKNASVHGDKTGYVSHCAEDAVVIDHIPPFVFRGPNACADEWDAIGAWAKQSGIAFDSIFQALTKPDFIKIEGGQAYAVFPVSAGFTEKGIRKVENLYGTFVLRRQGGDWRITYVIWSSLGWMEPPPFNR